MKSTLLCAGALVLALCVIALVACAAPTPNATPVPPTPTLMPPTPTAIPSMPTSVPIPPTPTPRPLPQAIIRVGNLDRTYLYYVPANLPRNAPLLFALHGWTQDAEGLRGWTGYGFEILADQNGFIVVYPNGYQQSWNVCLRAGPYPAKKQNVDDVGFIRALIAKFRADYGINPSQVFAMGMSDGGDMAYRLALEVPDEITAIAAIGANLPTDDNNGCRASGKPIPVLIMNGTSDSLNPYNGGNSMSGALLSTQASAEYFAKLDGQTSPPKTTRLPHRDASDPTSVDRTVWNDAGKLEVVLYTINGGGHVFPLGKFSTVYYYGMNFGQTTGDLDAPAEIRDFFSRQRSLK